MDLTATVCATSAASAACKPLKHHLLVVSAASSAGRSLAAPLAAMSAAVSAVESATEAASAAASAAAAGFAAEMTDPVMNPLEYSPRDKDMAEYAEEGYGEHGQPRRETYGPQESSERRTQDPLRTTQHRKHFGSLKKGDLSGDNRDAGLQHMHYESAWQGARAAPAPTENRHILDDSFELKAQLEDAPGPSPQRKTYFHAPLDNEKLEVSAQHEESIPVHDEVRPVTERRVSSRTKNKMSNIVRLGRERARLIQTSNPDSHPQKDSYQQKPADDWSIEAPLGETQEILPALSPQAASEGETPETSPLCTDNATSEGQAQQFKAKTDADSLVGEKRKRGDKVLAPTFKKDAGNTAATKAEKVKVNETPCKPRAAKLIAQRLVCAPRKRRRTDATRSAPAAVGDEDDDNDTSDADFESNIDDAETDDDDDEENEDPGVSTNSSAKGYKAGSQDVEDKELLKYGTPEKAIRAVPTNMSKMKLVKGMIIKASVLFDFMNRYANEKNNQVLEAVLALQTSQYWSLRCHCHGTAPRPTNGRSRSKSKKCKCGWRVCFRVVNEKETLEVKAAAPRHDGAKRDAQIAVALLMINSVHEKHTGHDPEPFLRGLDPATAKRR